MISMSFVQSLVLSLFVVGAVTNVVDAFAFLPIPSRVAGFRYPIALSASSMAEKVLQAPKWPPEWPYSETDFSRMDESDDGIFYDSPRLVSFCVNRKLKFQRDTRPFLLCHAFYLWKCLDSKAFFLSVSQSHYSLSSLYQLHK